MRVVLAASALLLAAACVSTDVTQLSRNEFVITTSAAPACGTGGARRVVARMAAVQTIRNGYDRFIIGGAQSQSNVRAIPMAPTTAYTTGQATTYGNTTYGSATTTYSGGGVMYYGSNDASLRVLMLRPGDPGYDDGLDARSVLGPDWERLVRDGIRTCG
jgi:hypothetical protein